MSRAFVSLLIAIAITVAGYFGIWEWPAWPAIAVLHLVFGDGDPWLELSTTARGAWLVGLITINVIVWGAIVYALMWSGRAWALHR